MRSIELREAGKFSEEQGKDAGGHGIKGTEVSDGLISRGAAEACDNVVGGDAGGFVYDEEPVHLVYYIDFAAGGRGITF